MRKKLKGVLPEFQKVQRDRYVPLQYSCVAFAEMSMRPSASFKGTLKSTVTPQHPIR